MKKVATVLLTTLALCSCDDDSTSSGQHKIPFPSVGPFWVDNQSQVSGTCDDNLTSTDIIRLKIPKDLGKLSKGRRVHYRVENSLDSTDDPGDTITPNDGTKNTEYSKNPLHIDLRTIGNTSPWVMVRAVLEDRDLKFMEAADYDGKIPNNIAKLQGVAYRGSKPGEITWICQPSVGAVADNQDLDKNRQGKSVVTFYIQRVKNAGEVPINFYIVPRNVKSNKFGQLTPILIDPKIHNDG